MYKLKEDAFSFSSNKINYNNYIAMSEYFIKIIDIDSENEYSIPFNLHFRYAKGMKHISAFSVKNISERISDPHLLNFYENEIKKLNLYCSEVSKLQNNEKHKKIPDLILDVMLNKSNINDIIFDFHENNINNYSFIFKHDFYLKYKKEIENEIKKDKEYLSLFCELKKHMTSKKDLKINKNIIFEKLPTVMFSSNPDISDYSQQIEYKIKYHLPEIDFTFYHKCSFSFDDNLNFSFNKKVFFKNFNFYSNAIQNKEILNIFKDFEDTYLLDSDFKNEKEIDKIDKIFNFYLLNEEYVELFFKDLIPINEKENNLLITIRDQYEIVNKSKALTEYFNRTNFSIEDLKKESKRIK